MNTEELNELAIEIHELAKEKGWWDQERTRGEIYALIHSEISEAVEEGRYDAEPIYGYDVSRNESLIASDGNFKRMFELQPTLEPHGELIELADVVILCLDWMAHLDIDIMGEYGVYSTIGRYFSDVKNWDTIDVYGQIHWFISHSFHMHHRRGDILIIEVVMYIDYMCQVRGWNLWEAVRIKHEYNKTRPHRHVGGRNID